MPIRTNIWDVETYRNKLENGAVVHDKKQKSTEKLLGRIWYFSFDL